MTVDDLHRGLRSATIAGRIVPVLCGSSYRNIGVQPLMDAVVRYLPHPAEKEHGFVKYYADSLCALAFKTLHDKHKGPMTFVRVYSGKLEQGQKVYNVNKGVNEKVVKLFVAYANDFKEVSSVDRGNIAVVTGLKGTITGDTLAGSSAAAKSAKAKFQEMSSSGSDDPVTPILAGIDVPEPVFFCTIEPESLAYQKQLDTALECLQREDPSFHAEVDSQSGQLIISGMGELHIDILKDRIRKEYGTQAYLGELQIAYRESVQEPCEHTVVLDKSLSDTRHRVKITFSLVPSHNSGKFTKVKVIATGENQLGKVRPDFLKAVENGVQLALNHGVILGYPVIDVKVMLLGLEVLPGTSTTMITAAASQCVAAALRKSKSVLLEPIMKVEVAVEDGYLGDVLTDLSTRRSEIKEVRGRESLRVVTALTPLSELIGYSTDVRTLTSGSASLTMEFYCYRCMNVDDQSNVIAKVTGFHQS